MSTEVPTRVRTVIPCSHSTSHTMSTSSSQPSASFSTRNFQSLFNAALREYREKTGQDIETDPLTARLLDCRSSDAVLEVLQEQAHAFNQFRNGDWKVELMRRLKPTIHVLLGLSTSGAFGEGVGLVGLTKLSCPVRAFLTRLALAEGSTSKSDFCRCWSPTCGAYFPFHLVLVVPIPKSFRPRRELALVTTHLSICSNVANII